MSEYPKTENLWRRNEETHKLIEGAWRLPHMAQIGRWLVTEKIDGTNIRVILDWAYDDAQDLWRPVVDVRGRSDAASLPKNFVPEAFDVDADFELTDRLFRALKCLVHGGESDDELTQSLLSDPISMVVYGEGYGAGIQKIGSSYSPTKQFRAFDVVTYKGFAENGHWGPGLWRTWEDVETVAEVAGFKVAPVLSTAAPLESVVLAVKDGLSSATAWEDCGARGIPAEGVVARTDPYLFDYRKNRVMFKLKSKDLA